MKGMRAAGHMGNAQVTTRNLRVVQVLAEDNTLLLEGTVPGPQGGYVIVQGAKAAHK
jgi:large subunit ribosomal protein L3